MPAHNDVDGPLFRSGPLSTVYPDPRIRTFDPRFASYVPFNAAVERLAGGCRWAEGPVWFGDHRQLVWSDIPNDRMLRWDEQTGTTSVFREPSGFANGNTRDHQGRLVTCEHGARRVTRTEHDGTITVLADRAGGASGPRLNSPNDVAIAPDGAVWFTDPRFGILSDYEGHRATPETHPDVYRIDPGSGAVSVVSSEFNDPNGLAFSPDGSLLYVVESTGAEGPDGRANPAIWVLDVVANGTGLGRRRLLVDGVDGGPDGFRIDEHGNLWCGWNGYEPDAHGVRVFADDGTPLGAIDLPEPCANVTFGGRAGTRLFMAASMSLYAVHLTVRGI
ncbi:SMP-30/gluconolactonase/LRE family protein [Curtobacterium sp. Leaf261]|uniref:SMP-30/gluconolactonase/LRE family protein n=1 Tax=Curtobacterium sp. Leaf261 TaxID=1736311 RepID=UPI0006F6B919|nr:SMP-30/gluconolactonase/LRE family protein [Curtobacterium sp. Leaf261]KQO62435.1 gluconolactonase [Curtobacterium sp. Leaf261]